MYPLGDMENMLVQEINYSVADLVRQGKKAAEKKDFETAEELLQQAVELDPDSFYAYFELGLLYFRRNKPDMALMYFNLAHQLNPEDEKTLNNLGVVYYSQKEFQKALDCFVQAISINSVYTDALYGAGKACLALNDTSRAMHYLRLCRLVDPRHPGANKLLEGMAGIKVSLQVRPLNIGFVSIWFERGQAYVTKLIRDALAENHNTFVFARTGGVYGKQMLETGGQWNVPNLTTYPDYHIRPENLVKWIKKNSLDIVIFNEEYDWDLVRAAKSTDAGVITYLDYYKEEWRPFMPLYDGILCSTFRSFDLVRSIGNAYYMGWAVDTSIFKPQRDKATHTFYHNAGWLGINYRKMTPAAILAFDALSRVLDDVSLFVHSQVGLEKLPQEVRQILFNNKRITYHVATVPAPGLYHRGTVHIFPSKLEGLGLPLMEGLACGLPAIVADAPPMNEFVRDGYNGLLARVGKTVTRRDNIAFPECIIDMNDLVDKMYYLATRPSLVDEMSRNALSFVEENLSLEKMRVRLQEIVEHVHQKSA